VFSYLQKYVIFTVRMLPVGPTAVGRIWEEYAGTTLPPRDVQIFQNYFSILVQVSTSERRCGILDFPGLGVVLKFLKF